MPPEPSRNAGRPDGKVGGIDLAELKGRRMGRVLTKLCKVTRDQVHQALELQQGDKKGKRIGEILLELGFIAKEDILVALAGQAGMATVDLKARTISDETFAAVPPETANSYQIIPVEFDPGSKRLVVALKSPENFRAVDDLRLLMGFRVSAVVAPPEQIDELLKAK